MAFVDYQSDFGVVYFTTPFIFFVEETNNIENQYTVIELVPQLIQNVLIELGTNNEEVSLGCTIPSDITPRKVKVYADDNNIYSFMFPFNFSTTDFSGSIEQMNQNTVINRFTVIGEKINTQKLNFLLKINGYN